MRNTAYVCYMQIMHMQGRRLQGGWEGVYPPGPPTPPDPPTPPGPPIPPIEKLGPPIKTPRPFQGICATVHMLDT